MRGWLVLMLATVAGCIHAGQTAVSREFQHEARLRAATVYIRECGTGWLISESFVVTNRHVVACIFQRNHSYATIDFSDGTTMKAFYNAMSPDPYVDLAILQLDGQVSESDILKMGNRGLVPTDTFLMSVGNPTPVTWIPTTYRVVKQPEHVEGGLDRVLILEGLALNGNSGSPVVGLDGKVVGVIFARAPGFAYAIPVQPYLVSLMRTVAPKQTWP